MFEFFFNLFNRKSRLSLPQVSTLEDVQAALDQIKYRGEFIDHQSEPEITWGQKQGDCEDFAALAGALLGQIGIYSQMLKIFCHDPKQSHAVCVFKHDTLTDGKYWYFSNAILRKTEFTQIKDVVYRVRIEKWVDHWELK